MVAHGSVGVETCVPGDLAISPHGEGDCGAPNRGAHNGRAEAGWFLLHAMVV